MAERAEPRDEHLLRRIAAGDENAFRVFYVRHQRAVYRFALHMTGRHEAAEEVVQEAFMTLMRETGKFDVTRGAPQAFLYGIARNHARRLLERERRYEPMIEESAWPFTGHGDSQTHAPHQAVLEGLTRDEVVEQVQSAVATLPLHYREAVTLCDLLGHDYASAAKILECPIGTVRSRLARGREALAEKLRAPQDTKKSAGGRL